MTEHNNLDLSGQEHVNRSFVGDIFRGTTNCNGTGFRGNGFKNAVFEGPAIFNSAKFHSGADFTGAVFKDHADFENAEFYGGKVDFSGAVFLAGASFKNAKFGSPYQRIFGEWEIRFSRDKEFYTLKIRKINGTDTQWIEVTKLELSIAQNFNSLLDGWEIRESQSAVANAFNTFHRSPQSVSFAGCRFGEMKIDNFPEGEVKEIIAKERARTEALLGNDQKKECNQSLKLFEDKYKENKFIGLSSEQEKTVIMYILARHLEPTNLRSRCQHGENHHLDFSGASFYPQGEVDFNKTLFFNGGDVRFDSATFGNDGSVLFFHATFGNGGNVGFDSATFSNGEDVGFNSATFGNDGGVWFDSTTFGNDGDVGFNSATFGNDGGVWFDSTTFGNDGGVWFDSTTFGNDGGVWFDSATFGNGGDIGFDSATFGNGGDIGFNSATFGNSGYVWFSSVNFSNGGSVGFFLTTFGNKGAVGFSKIIWINGGRLNFSTAEFGETRSIKFDECLFLCVGNISFKEARFPEKGSLMFQRCYFGRTKKVDFTGAFFRHTSFEGGEISWLKEEGKTPKKILQGRLGGKYDDLSPTTQKELNTRTTPVFEEGTRVLWKDLTTESAKNLTLRRVNLSHSIFDGMTLSHIQLNAPKWFEKGGRRMLFEETTIERDIGNLENVEDQYTQLKNNLEKQGNYLNAGYFHYGEQEIRREVLWKKRSLFNWFLSWCYKWLSGYGERPWWALVTTLFSILLFSFVLILLDGTSLTFLPEVLVEVITPFSWKGSESLKATLTNTHGIDLLRIYLLIVFQVFLLGIQLPLLVLAVRRRFKR